MIGWISGADCEPPMLKIAMCKLTICRIINLRGVFNFPLLRGLSSGHLGCKRARALIGEKSRPISEWESTHVCKYQYEYGVTEGLGVGKPPVFDTVIPCCSHNISTR